MHNSNQFDELQKNPTLTAKAINHTATHDMYIVQVCFINFCHVWS